MSKTEENRAFVLEFIGYVSDGNVQKILDSMADDAQWTIMGYPEISPSACTRNKAEVKELFEGLADMFPDGLSTTPRGVTADGDRVAVETETYGVLPGGKVYNNFYHMLYEVKDGKIQNVREYTDLNYVQTILSSI